MGHYTIQVICTVPHIPSSFSLYILVNTEELKSFDKDKNKVSQVQREGATKQKHTHEILLTSARMSSMVTSRFWGFFFLIKRLEMWKETLARDKP